MSEQVISKREAFLPVWVTPAVIYGCGLIMLACGFYLSRFSYHDDAFITLKYAANFLNGDGLVWNVGERVEGYSNFLFLCAVIAFGHLGIDLVVATQLINVTSYFGMLAVTLSYMLSQRQTSTPLSLPFIICFVLLFGNIDLIFWSLGGLESIFLAFFITTGAVLFLQFIKYENPKYLFASSIFFTLSGLTRLDAGLFIVITGGFTCNMAYQRRDFKLITYFALPLLIFFPYFFGKYLYYGELLPNTFYAKAGSFSLFKLGTGLLYTLAFMVCPPFSLSILIYLIVKQKQIIQTDLKLAYLTALISVHLLYILYSGGDHMPAFRFFTVIQPIIIITIYHLLIHKSSNWSRIKCKKYVAAVCAWFILQTTYFSFSPIPMDAAAYLGKLAAKQINTFPKGSLIALNTAGSTPYYAPDYTYIDMLGLNDYHIARQHVEINFDLIYQKAPGHNKGDGQYVIEREPDYIILGPASGRTIADKPWFLSDYQISKMADFNERYELKTVSIDVSEEKNIEYYPSAPSITNKKFTFTYYKKREHPKREH